MVAEWVPGSAVALEPVSGARLHREPASHNRSRQDSLSPACRRHPRRQVRRTSRCLIRFAKPVLLTVPQYFPKTADLVPSALYVLFLDSSIRGPIIYVQDLADVAVELKSPRRIFRKFRYAPRNSSCSSPRGAPWVIESGCGERSRTSSRDGPYLSALFATGRKAYGSSLSRSSNFHPETGSKRWGFRRSANTHRCSRTRA